MILEGISLNLTAAFLYTKLEGQFGKFDNLLNNAIEKTSTYFEFNENLIFNTACLKKVLLEGSKKADIKSLLAGKTEFNIEEFALQASIDQCLYLKDESKIYDKLLEIVRYLFTEFEKQLLRSTETHGETLAGIIKILHAESESSHHKIIQLIKKLIAQNNERMMLSQSDFSQMKSKEIFLKTQTAARILLDNGKERWNYPSLVSTIRMKLINEDSGSLKETPIIKPDEIIQYPLLKRRNFLVFGEAGIGKTTILLSICDRLLSESNTLIPIYLDAATWASSNKTILEYIESFPAFLNSGINSLMLSYLIENGKIIIVINGWNEIGADLVTTSREKLQQLFAGSSNAMTVISTRSVNDILQTKDTVKLKTRGFDWETQKSFVSDSLPAESAKSLIKQLKEDTKLRTAAKNPFVLNGIISLQEKQQDIPDNMFDLFQAIVMTFESDTGRNNKLKDPPLRNCHTNFLLGISNELNNKATTIISEYDARIAIQKIISDLKKVGVLGTSPEPADVIESLCNYHLLYRKEESSLRFAHQLFQEFFGACEILNTLDREDINNEEIKLIFQKEILNKPFWSDAIELVVSKFYKNHNFLPQANSLIELMIPIDLLYASELFGNMGFEDNEFDCWETFKSKIDFFRKQSSKAANDYSLQCAAATRSPYFSNEILNSIESSDENERYRCFDLAGGITLNQLGPNIKQRMNQWPGDLKKELLYSVADKRENVRFVEELAREDPSEGIQAEAIYLLVIYYGKTKSAISAWINASNVVKEKNNALGAILECWEPNNQELTKGLLLLAEKASDESVKRSIGLTLLEHGNNLGVEEAFKELYKSNYDQRNTHKFVCFLKDKKPEKIKIILSQMILEGKRLSTWMINELKLYPVSTIDEIANTLLNKISKEEHPRLEGTIAKFISDTFAEKLIVEGLPLSQTSWEELKVEDEKLKRLRAIEQFLRYIKKSSIIQIANNKIEFLTYDETEWIFQFLEPSDTNEKEDYISKLCDDNISIEQLDLLIKEALDKEDSVDISSCKLEARIAVITAEIDPDFFKHIILEVTKRHNNCYRKYEIALKDWIKKRTRTNRPSNPQYHFWFLRALKSCGFNVVTELLEIAINQKATTIIYEALVAISSSQWEIGKDNAFTRRSYYMANHFERIKLNRVFLQPDDIYQKETDEISNVLIQKIHKYLSLIDDNDDEKQTPRLLYSLSFFGKLLSHVPSKNGQSVLNTLLKRNDFRIYNYLNIAHGYINQGGKIPEEVIGTINHIWENNLINKWRPNNESHLFSDIARLHFFIKPINTGMENLNLILPQWIEKVYFREVINEVGEIQTNEGLDFFIMLLSHEKMSNKLEDHYFYLLCGHKTPKAFDAIIDMIGNPKTIDKIAASYQVKRAIRKKNKLNQNKELNEKLYSTLKKIEDSKYEDLTCTILGRSDELKAFQIIHKYLDEKKYPEGGEIAKRTILKWFSKKVQNDPTQNWYEIHPKANNKIRQKLYDLSLCSKEFQNRAKSILLSIEELRMSNGRPSEEYRHPNIDSGEPWPFVLYDK